MVWRTLRSTATKTFTAARSGRWRNARWLAVGIVVGIATTLAVPAAFRGRSELEPGELVILSASDVSFGGQRQELIEQWNKLHSKNKAKIIALSEGEHSEMIAHAQFGEDDVDIYNLDLTWTAEFADNGYIRPLAESGLDTRGFLENPLKTCRYDGKLWALPFNSDAGLLYYRTDLVPKPPGSWERIDLAINEAFPKLNQSAKIVAGYTGQLANYEGLTVNALEAIWGAGGEVVDQNGDVVIDDPRFADQVQAGLDRLRPSFREPKIILPQFLEHREKESTDAFRNGEVLFMRNWPVAYRQLQSSTGSAAGDSPGTVPAFDVTPLPGPSALGGQNLAIAAGTTKPKAAQALIEFLTDARSQQILFERGGFAATREVVYHDTAIIAKYKYAQSLLEAIKRARLRPVTPYYPRFSKIFHEEVHKALASTGRDPLPEDFADRLREALRGR